MIRIVLIFLTVAMLSGCEVSTLPGPSARDTDPANLLGKTWQWEATRTPVETITADRPERYTIRLTDDGRLQARIDCNSGGGRFQLSAGSLSFGHMISTRIACSPDSLEGIFMRELGRVESFYFENGRLYLGLKADSGIMRFRPAP